MPTLHRHEIEDEEELSTNAAAVRYAAVRKRAVNAAKRAARTEAFRLHRDALGFRTAADYQAWCRSHRLSGAIEKTADARACERLLARSWRCIGTVPPPHRKFAQAELRAMSGAAVITIRRKATSRMPPETLAARRTARRDNRRRLLQRRKPYEWIRRHPCGASHIIPILLAVLVGTLRRVPPERGHDVVVATRRLVQMLARLFWLLRDRPVAASFAQPLALPLSGNTFCREAVAEQLIARVLGVRLPLWFATVFPEPRRDHRRLSDARLRDWYDHFATRGGRARDLTFPIPMSRRAIGQLDAASRLVDSSPPVRLFRAAQALALGASRKRTKEIAESMLGLSMHDADREAFRLQITAWLVAHNDFPCESIDRIVFYVEDRRYRKVGQWTADGQFVRRPIDPRCSLSGVPTWEALAWLSREKQRIQRTTQLTQTAATCGYRLSADLLQMPDDNRSYLMVPLQDGRDFVDEGEAMSNCIADYFETFVRGINSLWSLRQRMPDNSLRRRVTVCVNATFGITQCYGRGNRRPDERERAAVREWARRRRLLVRTPLI